MATLESRLLALESKAGEQVSRTMWLAWRPGGGEVVVSAQAGNDVWQRQRNESADRFCERVSKAVRSRHGLTAIWVNHGEAPACQH